MGLLCSRTFTNKAMKFGRLQQYFNFKHSDKAEKPLSYFQPSREQFTKRQTITDRSHAQTARQDTALVASYRISKLISNISKGTHNRIRGHQTIYSYISTDSFTAR